MKQIVSRFRHDKRAVVGPFMAIAAIPVIGIAGIALDHGRQSHVAADVHNIAQEACDRVETPMIASLPLSDRADAAQDVIDRRVQETPGLDTLLFTASPVSGQVEIVARGDITTTLAGVAGIQAMTIDVTLDCGATPPPTADPVCLSLLDPSKKRSLHVHEAQINANGCEVHVRSDDKEAAVVHKNSTMHATRFCVAGEIINGPFLTVDSFSSTDEYIDNSLSTITGTTLQACVTQPDPHAAVRVDVPAGCTANNFTTNSNMSILDPGTYCGGIQVRAGERVKLRPGTYYITDGSLAVGKNGSLEGQDVHIVLAGKNADVSLEDANLSLSAGQTGPLAGMVFFQAYGEPATKVKSKGATTIELGGHAYLPMSDISIDGAVVQPIPGSSFNLTANKLDLKKAELNLGAR